MVCKTEEEIERSAGIILMFMTLAVSKKIGIEALGARILALVLRDGVYERGRDWMGGTLLENPKKPSETVFCR